MAASPSQPPLQAPKSERRMGSSSSSATVRAIHTNDELRKALNEAREKSKLLVLEFMAPWSKPCEYMKPVLGGIASDFEKDADFYTLDVDEFKGLARRHRVEALPTFVLTRNNYVKGRVVGINEDELRSSIQKHRATEIQLA